MRDKLMPSSLRYVESVARTGSIQRASKVLNIAASAINRHIIELEKEFGVPLFDRSVRGMRATAAGETLVAMARRWQADTRRNFAEIQQLRGVEQGFLRIGCMDSHANGLMAGVVQRVKREYPRIVMDIEVASTDEAIRLLLQGALDLVVAFNAPERRELHVLGTHSLDFGCVVAPGHPLARHKSASLQQCGKHPIVLQSGALVVGRVLEEKYGWLVDYERRSLTTNSIQLIKTMVKSGDYAAFLTRIDAGPELLDGSLVFIKIRDEIAAPETLSVVVDNRKSQPKIARLVADAIVSEVAEWHARLASN